MFRKISFMLLSIVGLFGSFKAQDINFIENSLFWQISGNGLPTPSYIVLTTSNLCEETPSLLAKINKIGSSITAYYTETGMNGSENSAMADKLMRVNSSNETVRKLLPAKTYLKLKNMLASANIDEKIINRYKATYTHSLVSGLIYQACNNVNYTETVLRAYADQYNVPVKNLFSLEETFSIIDFYDNNYWLKGIEYVLDNQDKMKMDLMAKAAFYKQENVKGIESIFASNDFFNARYSYTDIENKRSKWLAAKIIASAKSGGMVASINITNILNNETSVFNELKKQGYTVSPIMQ